MGSNAVLESPAGVRHRKKLPLVISIYLVKEEEVPSSVDTLRESRRLCRIDYCTTY